MADSGRPEEAEALYRRSIVVGGQDAMNSAMNNLANLLAQKGGTAEAEALYRKAIDAGAPAAIYNLAVLLARRAAHGVIQIRSRHAHRRGQRSRWR